jgi:hypothetical protein
MIWRSLPVGFTKPGRIPIDQRLFYNRPLGGGRGKHSRGVEFGFSRIPYTPIAPLSGLR